MSTLTPDSFPTFFLGCARALAVTAFEDKTKKGGAEGLKSTTTTLYGLSLPACDYGSRRTRLLNRDRCFLSKEKISRIPRRSMTAAMYPSTKSVLAIS